MRRKASNPPTVAEKIEIRKMHNKGLSIEQIAGNLEFKRHLKTIHNIIHVLDKPASDKRKEYAKKYREENKTSKQVLKSRITRFDKTGNDTSPFSVDELLSKVTDTPVCYLTGKPLDLEDVSSYEMDHIIPKSRNGGNTLENCGLALKDANRSKAHMTVSEFVELCKSVVEYNGFIVTRDPDYYDWDCANSC